MVELPTGREKRWTLNRANALVVDGHYVCGKCEKKVCKVNDKHRHDSRAFALIHSKCFSENEKPFFKPK